LLVLLAALAAAQNSWAAHAYAQFGDIKYSKGFAHFEWVNPQAPKGGELQRTPGNRLTNFDKYNPFTIKGTPAPGVGELMIETLLAGTYDEPATAYGLLAEDIDVAPDNLSVTFRLNPAARFQDGKPVMAADVKHSFDKLTSKEAAPYVRNYFSDVKRALVTGPRTIRFEFARASAELPLVIGGLPVFSRDWGVGKALDQIVMEPPIASGPYKIARVNFGRDITFERDPSYWAKDLAVRRGMYNFDRITYKLYLDPTAQTEAFKAGEFDFIQVQSAREWARVYSGKKFDSGELIKAELPHKNPGDFQSYWINLRRDKFKDVRVRQALELAFDFEWMNRRLMYSAYVRCYSWFNGSDYEASGLPDADELAILRPLRKKLPPRVFDEPVPVPPSTDPPGSLRDNLRKARDLLAAAGWTYRDGALRNAKGEPFTLEYLDAGGAGAQTSTPYFQALAKLGIHAEQRRGDYALIQKRLEVFDFDLFTIRLPGNPSPGAELVDSFGSQSADAQGSNNLMGLKDPAIDALLALAVSATTRPELTTRLRALDRVLRHGHYVVPQWFSNKFRVAYRGGKFQAPDVKPLYYAPDGWITSTWWTKR
jgi:microcin C transport system substrate-binding protein